jgi:hypothetical protein
MNKQTTRLLLIFVAVLLGSGLLVYVLLERSAGSGTIGPTDRPAGTSGQTNTNASPDASARVQDNGRQSILTEVFGLDHAEVKAHEEADRGVAALRVLLRFLIAALLAAGLAFRWRRGLSIRKRNPYVAQTQILLAVVAAAMMMIVGDSAARAFGIFAAASLVRFRTNIRDPKETTVLLVCLGVGLACGVGRLDMAIILAVFVLFTLLILEHFEEAQVFRSMELCVATRNVDRTNEAIKRVFARNRSDIELRQLDREDEEDPLGKIVYLVNLNTTASTDELSDQILAADPENIDKVEWEQKKSSTYIYN